MRNIALTFLLFGLFQFALGQNIYLDSSFNQTGIATLHHAAGEGQPAIVLVRPNGKILEVGYAYFDNRSPAYTRTTVVVTQFDATGQPDLSFGQNGMVVLNNMINDAAANDAILQPDGKLLITGEYLAVSNTPVDFIARLNEDGTLDNTFGVNGYANYPNLNLVIRGKTLLLQSDGKILMGGSIFTFIPPGSGTTNGFISRFNPDGTIDNTFGTNGMVTQDISPYDEPFSSFFEDNSGRIYAGTTIFAFYGGYLSTITRYLPNGAVDNSYGTSGTVILADKGGIKWIQGVTDNKILAAGPTGGYIPFIRRLNENGTVDPAFTGGATPDYGQLAGVFLDGNNHILVGTQFGKYLKFYTYSTDGVLDSLLTKTIEVGVKFNLTKGLALLSNGKILTGGSFENDFGFRDFCLLQLSADYQLDPAFGTEGVVIQPVGSSQSSVASMILDDQGRILIGGEADYKDETTIVNLASPHSAGFASRILPNGILDESFSNKGVYAVPQSAVTYNLVTRSDNSKILLAGGNRPGYSYSTLGLRQLLPDGTIDTSFGFAGDAEIYLPPSLNEVTASAVAKGVDGYIYIFGKTVDANDIGRIIVARITSDGLPDFTFGTDGILSLENISGNFEVASGLVLPDGKMMITGTYAIPASNIYVIRLLPDGLLDPSFGNAGVVLKPFGGVVYHTTSMAVDNAGNIVLCGYQGTTNNTNMFVGRLLPTGAKDLSFSDDGINTLNTNTVENAYAIAIQPDGRIVLAGMSGVSAATADPLILRLLPSGILDTSFAGTGYVITALPGINHLTVLALQPNGNYVAAGFSNNDYLIMRYLHKLTVAIPEIGFTDQELLVYPNPVRRQVTITYTLPETGNVGIDLLDLQGRVCGNLLAWQHQETGTHTESLLLPSGCVPGMYFLRIYTMRGARTVAIVVTE